MEILSKMIPAILYPFTPLFNLLNVHIIYPFSTGDNVKALVEANKDLVAMKDDLETKLEIAKRDGLVPTRQVERWLEKAKIIDLEAVAIEGKYGNRRFKCVGGCSLNCCSNYSLSRTAAEKLSDVQKLITEYPKDTALMPAPPHSTPTTLPAEQDVAVDLNLQLALSYLYEDMLGMIGIWGMGGVGKTHLLKKIGETITGNSSFGVVTFVTASKDCSVEKVQEAIAKKLLLPQKNDVVSQADVIRNFLKHRSFVILLDDLWEPLNLETVGVPFPLGVFGECKRNVVLTTRSEMVCGLMKVRKNIKVECLNEEDARRLFLEHVGEEALNSDPLIPIYAEKVLKELHGLPLALITTGSSMYSKKNPREWEDAIDQLQKSQLHEIELAAGTDITTFRILKFSYQNLRNDQLRECFLRCSLWPEDFIILIDELIQCWIGLGLIDMCNMRKAHNTGYRLIGNLKAVSLLEAAGDNHVKMHDVIRDMALWIMCNDGENKNLCIVRAGAGLKETPQDKKIWFEAEQISLMRNRIEAFHFPSNPCPSKLIMLQWNKLSLMKFGSVITLDALTYLDLSYNRIKDFPIEICRLHNLEYLNLSQNEIESLPEELQSLTNLKYLLLKDNNIHTIPEGVILKLKALEVLDIVRRCTDKYLLYLPSLFTELESLLNLKAVGMDLQDVTQLERLTELSNVPIMSLLLYRFDESSLLSLSISSFKNTGIHMNLSELHLYRTQLEKVVFDSNDPSYNFGNLENLKFVDLECLKEIVCNGLVPNDMFPNLTRLEFSYCNVLENISWIAYLPCLRILEMSTCNKMKQIVCNDQQENNGDQNVDDVDEERGRTSLSTFLCLKRIILSFFEELNAICDPTFSLPALESLEVYRCPKLKNLPFHEHTVSSKLKSIKGEREWWDGLEWGNENLKSSVQSFYQVQNSIDPTVSYV